MASVNQLYDHDVTSRHVVLPEDKMANSHVLLHVRDLLNSLVTLGRVQKYHDVMLYCHGEFCPFL
jgi:hypothetical protein